MRMQRIQWLVLALVSLIPLALRAQEPASSDTSVDKVYEQRRAELVKELQDTQDRLSGLRSQRVQLEARIENVLAESMQRRAQQLLLSNEQNALLQLDGVLASAQDNMMAQRERMQALGDAVRRKTGAVLVVLLRADSVETSGMGPATLQVDNAPAVTRNYSAVATQALQQGAVDQLFRADVLPTAHAVQLTVNFGGQPLTQSVTVSTQGESVTYVQFAVHSGQLVPSSWTSKGTTPY